ncbi:MAG: hypothetical protein QM757_28825 [Paludibaculum sp.]
MAKNGGEVKQGVRKIAWLAAVACICLAPTASADTVDMKMIGLGNMNAMAGDYMNPYTATVNGVTTTIICDDFAAVTYLNETWQATTHTLADLSGTRWGGVPDALHLYNAAAYLTLQLLDPNITKVTQGEISFAIWGLFTPSAITTNLASYSPAYAKAATQYINTALAATTNSIMDQFSNFVIYTPIAGTAANCWGAKCTAPPQEFLAIAGSTIRTPETASLPILAFNLLAVIGVIAFLRRRMVSVE